MEPHLASMRAEWDQRAEEDANYYVAFGRRNQSEDEFFASGADQVRHFETELRRRPASFWKSAVALEIGCGPGRLMRPLSRHFAHLHGIDVSAAMIRRAHRNLESISNITLHHTEDSTLARFADGTIDFIYSYAVFQHIPSRDVVMGYLAEAVRVLKPGGLFAFQINGLPDRGHVHTTWDGVRISAEEIIAFARESGVLLLALTDRETQYMWVTVQKPEQAPSRDRGPVKIISVCDSYRGTRAIPVSGRFGAVSVWVNHLPESASLFDLSAKIDGRETTGRYISPVEHGFRYFNFTVPPGTRTGLVPVDLYWRGERLTETAWARMIPPPPRVPRVVSVTDGIDLMSSHRIVGDKAKITMDEIADPSRMRIQVSGKDAYFDWFLVNALHECYEFNLVLPQGILRERPARGPQTIELTLGTRRFAPIPVVVADQP